MTTNFRYQKPTRKVPSANNLVAYILFATLRLRAAKKRRRALKNRVLTLSFRLLDELHLLSSTMTTAGYLDKEGSTKSNPAFVSPLSVQVSAVWTQSETNCSIVNCKQPN